jgi:hypothetical protein
MALSGALVLKGSVQKDVANDGPRTSFVFQKEFDGNFSHPLEILMH